MLDRFLDLLRQPKDELPEGIEPGERHQVAAAALLLEAAGMDESVDDTERGRIRELIRWRFGLDDDRAGALIDEAAQMTKDSVQFYGYTATIREAFDAAERVQLIEMLWDVAYADGQLHDLEASLVRRVAGLLYVSDRDNGAARKRVLSRYGLET